MSNHPENPDPCICHDQENPDPNCPENLDPREVAGMTVTIWHGCRAILVTEIPTATGPDVDIDPWAGLVHSHYPTGDADGHTVSYLDQTP